MSHDHTRIEQLLDSHAAVEVGSAPPPAMFMAAVRRRRHTRRAMQAGAMMAILAVVASSALMLNRPKVVSGPMEDPLARAMERPGIGSGSLIESQAGIPLDRQERAFLRPGADLGSEEVRVFLASI